MKINKYRKDTISNSLVALLLFSVMMISNINSTELFAQEFGSIHGRVINAETNKPLTGANIIIKEIGIGTTTDIFRIL